MTTSVILATAHRDGLPVGRPKLSQDVTPTAAYQYLQVPAFNKQGDDGQGVCLVCFTSDANILIDIVIGQAQASDTKAVPLRPPAGGVRSYTCYARTGERIGFKTGT